MPLVGGGAGIQDTPGVGDIAIKTILAMLKTVFYAFILPVPGMITELQREVSKMAPLFTKTTSIAAEISQEMVK